MVMQVQAGAEPVSIPGGPHGALLLHGFTATPQSLGRVPRALADAGFAVEAPLLPGHGTSVDDLEKVTYDDWYAAAAAAYAELAARSERVVVVGQSMGGTLAGGLLIDNPAIAGAVFVNPFIGPLDDDVAKLVRGMAESGDNRLPPIGNGIADPTAVELAYEATPVQPLLSLSEAALAVADGLGAVQRPVLIFTSVNDPVVVPVASDVLAERVSGPVERVTLVRSYHVAMLDFEKDEVERRTVEFALRVTA